MCCFPFVCLSMTALFHKSTTDGQTAPFSVGPEDWEPSWVRNKWDSGGVTPQSSPPSNRPEGKIIPMIQRGAPKGLNLHPVLPTHLAQPLLHIQLLLRGLERTKK